MYFSDADIFGQVGMLVCLEESQEMDETPEGIYHVLQLKSLICNPI